MSLLCASVNATSFLNSQPSNVYQQFCSTTLLGLFKSKVTITKKREPFKLTCSQEEDYYLLDAPVSAGDGFSFSGGKYSDGSSPADEWFKKGKMVRAYVVGGSGEKAKDPIFGLTMGSSSQASDDIFRVCPYVSSFCSLDGFVLKVEVLIILQ